MKLKNLPPHLSLLNYQVSLHNQSGKSQHRYHCRCLKPQTLRAPQASSKIAYFLIMKLHLQYSNNSYLILLCQNWMNLPRNYIFFTNFWKRQWGKRGEEKTDGLDEYRNLICIALYTCINKGSLI